MWITLLKLWICFVNVTERLAFYRFAQRIDTACKCLYLRVNRYFNVYVNKSKKVCYLKV